MKYTIDHTAVITGAADGLGFALAKRLTATGIHVAVLDVDAAKVQNAQQQLGPYSRAFAADVTDPVSVERAVNAIVSEFGRIDILVNCAGITGKTNTKSHEVELADFDQVFNVNVRGSFIVFQAVIPHMLRRNYGRILHVASIAGKEGNAGMVAYSTSKAAVIAMAKVQGKEYADTGITVNALAPAVIRTALVDAMPPEQVQYMTDKIPMKRCGALEEFAEMAAFIVSPQNSFCTGFTFDLSGGRAVY
ncbi:MAG: SDR family oxidoreductase [Cupriavidus sp.]|nr:MAG: SDR family oxidoreductase [Cupriavidus sp.]